MSARSESITHKGNIQGEMIEGAFRVLDEFEQVKEHTEAMKAMQVQPPEEIAFAMAAPALRFDEGRAELGGGHRRAPVTPEQLFEARRAEDLVHSPVDDLSACAGERDPLRPAGPQPAGASASDPAGRQIDRGVGLNRALWMLAEEMRKLKG